MAVTIIRMVTLSGPGSSAEPTDVVTLADHTREVEKLTDQVTRLLVMYENLEKELKMTDDAACAYETLLKQAQERLVVLMQSLGITDPVDLSDTPTKPPAANPG